MKRGLFMMMLVLLVTASTVYAGNLNKLITYDVEGKDTLTKQSVEGELTSREGAQRLCGTLKTPQGVVKVSGAWVGLGLIRASSIDLKKVHHYDLIVVE